MTVPSRRQIRTAIAEFFGGPVMDPTTRVYRTTPLAAEGLAGVCAYMSKRVGDAAFTQGLITGRAMGALMLVHLPHDQDVRKAWSGTTGGVRQNDVTVQLHLYHLAQADHCEDAQADLEDLIQAIKDRIHGDRTLGTTDASGLPGITQAGETPMGIVTDMDPPVISREVTESYAVMAFEATVFPQA